MASLEETVTIRNVVASTAMEKELNLDTLADDLPDAEYDPSRFGGLLYRTESPKATTMIFRSGRVITTGATSIAEAHNALGIVFGSFAALGVNVPADRDISIVNIVSTADLGQPLNLPAIAIGLGLERTEYEPEQFPGLVYRLDIPNLVVLLFGSGKLVIVGGNTQDDTIDALEAVQAKLIKLDLL